MTRLDYFSDAYTSLQEISELAAEIEFALRVIFLAFNSYNGPETSIVVVRSGVALCTFSKALKSIWRTRSRETQIAPQVIKC